MTISDEVFSKDLDAALKRQGMLIKDRAWIVKLLLCQAVDKRDDILDFEEKKAREVEQKKKDDKHVPLEDTEQIEYVRWFRQLFIGVDIAMFRNDGFRTESEKPKQILMGLLKGASDLLILDWHLYVEMKRIKGSVIGDDQYLFAEKRLVNGDFHFFAFGAEDAKIKTLEFILENKVKINIDIKIICGILSQLKKGDKK